MKSYSWIRRKALERGMISPFSEKQVRVNVISHGCADRHA